MNRILIVKQYPGLFVDRFQNSDFMIFECPKELDGTGKVWQVSHYYKMEGNNYGTWEYEAEFLTKEEAVNYCKHRGGTEIIEMGEIQ